MNVIYDFRQYLKYLFIVVAMLIAIVSLLVSDSLINKLAEEEHQKMEVWTEAYRIIIAQETNEVTLIQTKETADQMKLILKVMENNTTIPMILYDDQDNVIAHRNIDVPEKGQDEFFRKKIAGFKTKHEPFVVDLGEETYHYLCYDDSVMLKRLGMYPYVQLLVVFVFIVISFLALASTKKAEQNKVWVGLSKETAHQLGTPISSLIAWIEYLKTKDIDAAYLKEMEKDVKRLEMIADRFSKIGSNPNLQPLDVNDAICTSCEYMQTRVSSKVSITTRLSGEPALTLMNESLFSWVVENLTKNAVDAMDGQGSIIWQVIGKGRKIWIDVTDTGKGIPKSKFNSIFTPGYTTKTRGWGLGLSLVKRIVESHPGGKIYVRNSEIGKGTTFRIELRKYTSR
ncbi:MAG: HAMP domain-containing histidine kinase [Tannerella sp.]|jgi:nitrogen-specific signal transduction histidine kinase|nr:HAMP domain-containing histidine kinase [Tannerella sp.]